MSNDIWQPVVGFEGYYEVSRDGRVRSIEQSRASTGSPYKAGEIAQRELNSGYLRVCLSVDNEQLYKLVHVVVAEAFLGKPNGSHARECGENSYQVDHINDKKKDNRVENLRWVPHHENVGAKVTPQEVREIRDLYETGDYTHEELAKEYGMKRRGIGRIVNRKNWTWLE